MRSYKTLSLSDEPKLFGIPITTGIPLIFLTGLGVLFGYGFQGFTVGGLISWFMHVQFGGIPIKQFFAILYWYLPRGMTVMLFKGSPDSANRFYIR